MEKRGSPALGMVGGIALTTFILHLWAGNHYGFHRDELATLDDARHLAWGYIAYPPVTPFFGRLSLILFGASLTGFRAFAALAQAVAVLMTGSMAWAMGGSRRAQTLAALAAVPFGLVAGSVMQYVSFDYLSWVLAAYCVIRMLRDDDPRWWLGIGAAMGFGMMAKYAMVFLAAALGVALLLTPARKYLASRWMWGGIALAALMVAPNLIWQARHSFISVEFLRYIHARDVSMGRTKDFLPDQLKMMLLAFPLALAGLLFYLRSREGRQFRAVGWLYLTLLLLFVAAQGRGYYLAAGYPMLYAGGAVWFDQRGWRWGAWTAAFAALLVGILLAASVGLPVAPVGTPLARWAFQNNGDLREELGWEELAQTVGEIHRAHPETAVMAGNYGEAGAIDLYGPRYGLPQAIAGTNSYWERGYGDPAPSAVILLGFSRKWAEERFTACEVAGQTGNRFGIANEESQDHPDILLCSGLKESWESFWKKFRRFG